MTVQIADLIQKIRIDLQDPDGVRWTEGELLAHINEAQVAVALARPDEVAHVRAHIPTPGRYQDVPEDAFMLVDVTHNLTGNHDAITKVQRELLDVADRRWANRRFSSRYIHYMYDPMTPRVFQLYPPVPQQGDTGEIAITVAVYPEKATLAGAMTLADRWERSVFHFALYRAWSKDAEYAGNAAIAVAHLQAYNATLGIVSAAA